MMILALASAFALGGSEKQSGVTRTLRVEVFDRLVPGYTANDNFMTRWIDEHVRSQLGFNVDFVSVQRTQEVDKLNLLMALNEAPDLVFTYSVAVVSSYVRNDGLTDLTDLLLDYAPALQEYLGDDLLEYGRWGGRQWAIPAKRIFTGSHSGFIRRDWLDALGLDVPTTLDEFHDVLVAFRDGGVGFPGSHVIPFGITLDPNNIDWTSRLLVESFITTDDPEDRACLERWTMPGYKEGIRYLNRLYGEELLSPNFALDRDGQQYIKDIVRGNIGSFIHNFDEPYRVTPGISTALAKNVPGARLVPFDSFPDSEGHYTKFMYNPAGIFIFIPAFSTNSDIALRYLDWMVKPDVLFFLQNGIQGEQYRSLRSGIPVDFVPNDQLPDDEKYNSIGDLSFVANGREFGSTNRNLEALAYGYPGFEDEVREAMQISLTGGLPEFRFDQIIESEVQYRQALDVKGAEIFVKSITCDPAQFDTVYDRLTDEYMAMGGSAIEAEKRAAYRRMTSRNE